jgi:hypothetical protein
MMREPGIKAGTFDERALLGDTLYRLRWEKDAELRNRYNIATSDSFELNEKMQPWPNPADPQKPFIKELRDKLVFKLVSSGIIKGTFGIPDKGEAEKIKAFTSVEFAPLDDYNGVDAYFRVQLPGGERLITLDVSLEDKIKTGKQIRSDVFIHFTDDLEKDDAKWKAIMAAAPSELFKKLMSSAPLKMENKTVMDTKVLMEPVVEKKKRQGELDY